MNETDSTLKTVTEMLTACIERRDTAIRERDELAARVKVLEDAGQNIKPYLVWTIGPGSPGHHPTMPSAVAAFVAALQEQGK
jgi:hypothetical protein